VTRLTGLDVYRRLYPTPVKSSRGLKVGDHVRYTKRKSPRLVDRARGKYAGVILELRAGPGGPVLYSSTGVGGSIKVRGLGPRVVVARLKPPPGSGLVYGYSDVRDLVKIRRR